MEKLGNNLIWAETGLTVKPIQVEEGEVVKLQDGPQQDDYLNFEGVCPSSGKPQKGIILSWYNTTKGKILCFAL